VYLIEENNDDDDDDDYEEFSDPASSKLASEDVRP
jgi:hypothetical protein